MQRTGLEPARIAPLVSEASLYANFSTSANILDYWVVFSILRIQFFKRLVKTFLAV